jgi:hypothetical protein
MMRDKPSLIGNYENKIAEDRQRYHSRLKHLRQAKDIALSSGATDFS